ncbi:MAG TPA: cyanophycin synthetase [Flavisolibacter sp.]|jgi:cyanophycin synthetase|nr:cyanophycin synthetase [Flavisolibacter sp.]
MQVRETKVLRGPNFWSIKKTKLIQILLDLEELEFQPTNKIPGFYERIQQLLPSLYEHECSEGHKGGFFERIKDGTWMGHVIEHIALELQGLAGMKNLGFGRTRGAGKEGWYHVVFSYEEEQAGLYAGKAAVRVAEGLIKGEEYDVQKDIREIHELWHGEKLGPTTYSIVEEAQKRNIPFLRLDEGSLVQLGYGCKQKRVEAAITCCTNSIAVDLAGDKDRTKKLLTSAKIPVPFGEVVSDVENLKRVIEFIGFPIVLKPLNGNHGKGATINITNWPCGMTAFQRAQKFSEKVIVEKFVQGYDFRVLVVNNKFVAAALRKPAFVIGDGRSTIQELIDAVNKDPRRGYCHEKVLTSIKVDDVTIELLAKENCTLETILPLGQEIFLKPTANLSTGGTATDVTDEVHPANIFLFERLSRVIDLDICGIDIMAPDLKIPICENGGVVLEVNAAPGFRMHLEPTSGQPRNVAKHVVDMLFKNSSGRIPIVAITGTNGKTTTSRLISQMAKHAGFITGYTTTDGIYINDHLVLKGDCSGPASAQFVLKDPCVDYAVFECARGGILRSGLGFDQCDGAVVTNVAEDHLGLDGIDTIEKLANVKSVVPETVNPSGYAVLNADDDLVYAMKDRVKCKVALFSMYPDSLRIEEHCSNGGLAAVYENGYLLLRTGNHIIPIEETKNIPITFGGKAEFNIANALAAILAAYTNRIKLNTIREVLKNFVPSHETTPGRLNVFDFSDFNVIIDYAHNPHAVKAVGKFINAFSAKTKVGIITGVGDRRDEDIIALGEESAKVFNEIIIRHDDDMRGRTIEEVENLITRGIVNINPDIPITYSLAECESVDYAIAHAIPGSVIVVLTDNIKKVTECIIEHQRKYKEQNHQWQTAV